MSIGLLDAAGRPRSPATVPGYRSGCVPRNKGRRYPADPPRVEEIIAVMRAAGDGPRSKTRFCGAFLARPERFELPTFGSVDRRSIQLSYGRLSGRF
jgi:hypothetical protein